MARSLIQQRIAIDRQRVIGVVCICLGAAGTALGVALAAFGTAGLPISAVAFLAWFVVGIGNVVRARARRIRFESEHGADAGKQ